MCSINNAGNILKGNILNEPASICRIFSCKSMNYKIVKMISLQKKRLKPLITALVKILENSNTKKEKK